MAVIRKRRHQLETEWLRAFASTYLPADGALIFEPPMLRDAEVSLIDLRHLFKKGRVVTADKLDGPGACWSVVGCDCEGNPLEARVDVVSEEITVILRDVRRPMFEKGSDDDAA
ncbi:hypothetical protein [Rhodoplanes serenus]|uniref:hypothetical protein n=1 Tax=Rhodoplanes serenus TaxID=200615 RepID=UPI000DAE8E2B|nr:hypothetical protein [Rhodoplanes serenus]RAI37105.1 hypothetical protein CH340_00945 [Rhodoplanes serenus]